MCVSVARFHFSSFFSFTVSSKTNEHAVYISIHHCIIRDTAWALFWILLWRFKGLEYAFAALRHLLKNQTKVDPYLNFFYFRI